jgi:hypothetical protein
MGTIVRGDTFAPTETLENDKPADGDKPTDGKPTDDDKQEQPTEPDGAPAKSSNG